MGKQLEFPKKDISGLKYGKLTVLRFSKYGTNTKNGGRPQYWLCRCDCGDIKEYLKTNLKPGKIISCGCYRRSISGEIAARIEDNNQSVKRLLINYRTQAIRRNLSFELTLEEFISITSSNCYLCGKEPSSIVKTTFSPKAVNIKQYIYNGVDRFNNSIGYTIENCKPCCGTCNMMKKDLDIDTFLGHMKRILDYIEK